MTVLEPLSAGLIMILQLDCNVLMICFYLRRSPSSVAGGGAKESMPSRSERMRVLTLASSCSQVGSQLDGSVKRDYVLI